MKFKIIMLACALLLAIPTAKAQKSVTVRDINIDMGSTLIKTVADVTVHNSLHQKVNCTFYIYDKKAKDFLTSDNPASSNNFGYYALQLTLDPQYADTRYRTLTFTVDPNSVNWTSGDYQIVLNFTDASGDQLKNGLLVRPLAYNAKTSPAGTRQATPNTKTTTSSDASTTASKNVASQTTANKGYYYFKSSETGMVCLLSVHFVEEKYGGGKTATGAGGVFTYTGRVNGRDRWQSYTIRLLQEAKRNPFTGQTYYSYNGKSERIPNNENVIFTTPDMSALYTLTDTFDKRISREEWLKADKEGLSYGSSTPQNFTQPDKTTSDGSRSNYVKSNNSGYAQCRHCHGTGRCSTCNGTGDRGDTHNHEKNKVVWKCTTCSGSGKCLFCNGTGRIRN